MTNSRAPSPGGISSAQPPLSDRNTTSVLSSRPVALELVEHAPDALVHPVDLGGVRRHPGRLPLAVDDVLPRRHPLVARGQRPRGVDDPLLDEPLQPLLAQLVPAGVEATGVARDVLVVRVQRPVRRGVGEEEEERVVAALLVVLGEELDRRVGDRVGVEPARLLGLVLDVGLLPHQRARPVEGARPLERAEEAVEAASGRPGRVGGVHVDGEVPLAGEVRRVARVAAHLRDRRALLAEVARVAVGGVVEVEDADPDLVRVEPGQQRRARRAAARGVVELRHPHPAGGQPVEGRRPHLAAVGARCRRSPCRRPGSAGRRAAPRGRSSTGAHGLGAWCRTPMRPAGRGGGSPGGRTPRPARSRPSPSRRSRPARRSRSTR